jgi:hypothetical protein
MLVVEDGKRVPAEQGKIVPRYILDPLAPSSIILSIIGISKTSMIEK